MGVEHVERHLHRVPREALRKHALVDRWRFMSGEADVAGLALLLRLEHRFGAAAGRENPLGIVLPDNLMDLPEIEVVGLQALQAVLEFEHRVRGYPIVGAILGHQERLLSVAVLREGLAHPHFTGARVVFPRVIEEIGAGIDRLLNDLDALGLIAQADVRSANSENADVLARFTKWSSGNSSGHRCLLHLIRRRYCHRRTQIDPAFARDLVVRV